MTKRIVSNDSAFGNKNLEEFSRQQAALIVRKADLHQFGQLVKIGRRLSVHATLSPDEAETLNTVMTALAMDSTINLSQKLLDNALLKKATFEAIAIELFLLVDAPSIAPSAE